MLFGLTSSILAVTFTTLRLYSLVLFRSPFLLYVFLFGPTRSILADVLTMFRLYSPASLGWPFLLYDLQFRPTRSILVDTLTTFRLYSTASSGVDFYLCLAIRANTFYLGWYTYNVSALLSGLHQVTIFIIWHAMLISVIILPILRLWLSKHLASW